MSACLHVCVCVKNLNIYKASWVGCDSVTAWQPRQVDSLALVHMSKVKCELVLVVLDFSLHTKVGGGSGRVPLCVLQVVL